ncbi:putative metallohydrolase (TIGR04338 family) [Williamsia limnetica]|uniref:Putative metallohydrolase (TIGR04338 family) n=1 Tax=Williamsia limnetica TaxID=882452 RepID=A0A318RNR9_WILLI|nr:TIGR04338 family metallohydrolase [Williamsia limnetica]PYE20265.1 putative metallohydrolase (TIGR04338 family) [Williamsia limnetica]
MTERDSQRSALYAAERLVHNVFERASAGSGALTIAGTSMTLPPEARFGSVDSVRTYVDRVLAMTTVAAQFPRAQVPVTVRTRRGQRQAHYEYNPAGGAGVIAVPVADDRWAMRELVVLHELAHHLSPGSATDKHGPLFAGTLIDLVGLVLGPEAALVYRITFGDSGIGVA